MHYALYSCDRSEMATAFSSSAASGKKRKRVVLTIEDKLNICDLVKNGRSLTSVAAEFNVGKVNRSLNRTFHLSESLRSQRVRISDTLLYISYVYTAFWSRVGPPVNALRANV